MPKFMRGLRTGGLALVGVGLIDAGASFLMRRSEHPEEPVARSALFAAGDVALWTFMPSLALAKEMYGVTKAMGEAGYFDPYTMQSVRRSRLLPYSSWHYNDTERAYTMRQRAVQKMMESKMNVRSALGNEARSLHRGAL